jgi:O-antigen/teichoic acid export membrane protein
MVALKQPLVAVGLLETFGRPPRPMASLGRMVRCSKAYARTLSLSAFPFIAFSLKAPHGSPQEIGVTPMTLRDRALKAGAWTLGAHGVDLAVRLITNLIMTRLLFPEAFGVIGTATALIVGLGLISDFGIRAVIIQSPRGNQDDFLRSAWAFQLLRGIALWLILLLACLLMIAFRIHNWAPTGTVFADPSFPIITALMGLGLVLGGAESTSIVLNLRRLHFRPIVLLDMTSRLLSLPIMFAWALTSPSVWSLVAGALAANLVRLTLSHVLIPGPRMALKWDNDHIQEIIQFGKWIAVSSSASFVSQQIDIILFAFLLPSSTLGLYLIAKLLISTAEGLLEKLNSSLALPILSEIIRTDRHNLKHRFYRYRLPIDLAAGLVSGFLSVTGGLIIDLLYDLRYSDAGPMVQVLALAIAIYPFQIIRSAFTATADARIVALVSIVQAGSLILSILIGFAVFGPFGALVGVAAHRVFPSALFMWLGYRRQWVSMWHELRLIPLFIGGAVLGFGIMMIGRSLLALIPGPIK